VLLQHLPTAQTVLTCTGLPAGIRQREGVYLLDLRRIIQESKQRRSAAPAAGGVSVAEEKTNERVAVRSRG
jgi:hypothetical protein